MDKKKKKDISMIKKEVKRQANEKVKENKKLTPVQEKVLKKKI